jgi:serine/threonine protein phosphatase 1
MISNLFRRKSQAISRLPDVPAVPEATVVWAVGDIHGRLDLLEPLVQSIIAAAQTSEAARKVVVFLGDYVDRGPESRGVLALLASLSPGDIEWRFLKGNHEEAMLDFLVNPSAGARWCEYGGDATLRSYGLSAPDLKHRAEAWSRLSADLDHKVSTDERRFLESLELSLSVGDYFFVHAGARPGVSLARQSPDDLLWIRRSFLDSEVEFEQVVVHGHTPTAEVHSDRRRIGVDTRAYGSGILSAVRLCGAERSLLQAMQGPDGVRIETGPIASRPEPAAA